MRVRALNTHMITHRPVVRRKITYVAAPLPATSMKDLHKHTKWFIRFVDQGVTPMEEAEHLLRKFVLPMFRRQRDKVSWALRGRPCDPENPDPKVDHIVLSHDGCDGFLQAVLRYVAEVCDVDITNFDNFMKLAAAATGHDAFGQPNDLGFHFRAMKAIYWRYIKLYHKIFDGQKIDPLFEPLLYT